MNNELRPYLVLTFHFQTPPMPFRHNVIRQTQPQTRALPGRFGGEKGLEDFLTDGFRNAIAIVLHLDDDLIARFLGGNGDGGVVWGVL